MTFGEFDQLLFKKQPGTIGSYLRLLNPRADAITVIDEIRGAIAASGPELHQSLTAMLRELNWRPQIVAATAMLIDRDVECLPELWRAIYRPCWVSPQLTAVASRLDPNFLYRAKVWFEGGCQMQIDEALRLTAADRHSALGPSSLNEHAAKVAASLAGLCWLDAPTAKWLVQLLKEEWLRELMRRDLANCGEIAVRWRLSMDQLLC